MSVNHLLSIDFSRFMAYPISLLLCYFLHFGYILPVLGRMNIVW